MTAPNPAPSPNRCEFGTCIVPHDVHGWLEPVPTIASWRALIAAGVTHVRVQYKVGRPDLFDLYAPAAIEAGMRITANVVDDVLTANPKQIAAETATLARKWGKNLWMASFGNEPGAVAQKYEEEHGERSFMPFYFRTCLFPFVDSFRAVNPRLLIGGCDADSTDIQQSYMDAKDSLGDAFNMHLIHPYWHLGGGDYASMGGANGKPGFMDVIRADPRKRPYKVAECDAQNEPDAVAFYKINPPGKAGSKPYIISEFGLRELLKFYKMILRDYPDCKGIDGGDVQSWIFKRTQFPDEVDKETGKVVTEAVNYSTFYTATPELSDIGREFVAVFAPLKPPSLPGRRRVVRK